MEKMNENEEFPFQKKSQKNESFMANLKEKKIKRYERNQIQSPESILIPEAWLLGGVSVERIRRDDGAVQS